MSAEESLIGFGFTELEARVYCELLRRSPASGYALAKAIGKAPANVYQALDSLIRKGAAMVDESGARSYRPVPSDELLASLEVAFESRLTAASTRLAGIEQPARGDRIYQLKSASQVKERARRIIDRANDVLLFDLFPLPWLLLRDSLEEAAARGVVIAGLIYQTLPEPPSFTALSLSASARLVARWPGAQVTLVADGREHLVALLSRGGDQVLYGSWSDSPYLSCLQHNGLASELRILDASPDDSDRYASLSLLHAAPSGLRDLVTPQLEGSTDDAPFPPAAAGLARPRDGPSGTADRGRTESGDR